MMAVMTLSLVCSAITEDEQVPLWSKPLRIYITLLFTVALVSVERV